MNLRMLFASAFLVFAGTAVQADDYSDCFRTSNKDYDNPALFDGAVASCTRHIAARQQAGDSKDAADGFSARAYWKTKKGLHSSAIEDFNRAIEINPQNVEYYDYRADVFLATGDLDRAIDDYNRSIRIDPTYAAAYYSRGRVYEKKGDIGKAVESYRAALVPPVRRKIAMQERIQIWAQGKARERLQELGK